ncbi:MAG: hypothetical protein VR64_13490 [Desulfatitalea sp. BRH_c12]|jgi:hypothetical protein|nr:MAG: hypothetical protein VR64_13490 [Desulfatitalea sp. BRH_c12]
MPKIPVPPNADKLSEMINKAILDCQITNEEYNEIQALADADGVTDKMEEQLLAQLHQMIADGTVKRVF